MATPLSFGAFLLRWLRAASAGAWDIFGYVSGGCGLAIWAWNRYWPNSFTRTTSAIGLSSEAAMNDLMWQVPLGAAGLAFLYRLVRAPYEIHRSLEAQVSTAEAERDELNCTVVTQAQDRLAAEQVSLRVAQLENQLADAIRVAAERIGADEWLKLADDFAALPGFGVDGDWSRQNPSGQETWHLRGGPSDCRSCETLCRQAGTMLMKSPHVLESLSGQVVSHTNPAWRWLEFLKECHGGLGFTMCGHGVAMNDGIEVGTIMLGEIRDVRAQSVMACRECATIEIAGV